MAEKPDRISKITGKKLTEGQQEWIDKIATAERISVLYNTVKNIPSGQRVALIGHDSPDADCFGGFAAFKHFLTQVTGVEVVDSFAVTDGDSVLQNQAIGKYLGIDIKDQKFYDENIDLYRARILLDTNETHTTMENVKPDMIFDHHKVSEVPLEGCFMVYEDAGASCTMIYVLFCEGMGIRFTQEILVGLALGIALDTRALQDEGTKEVDMWAHREILSLLDEAHYRLYFHYFLYAPISFGSIKRKGRAFGGSELENNVIFAFLGETEASEDNSYGTIVDELMRVKGVEIAVVVGIRETEFEKVSIRVESETMGYEKVLKECFKVDFYSSQSGISWGGRSTSAGGAMIPLTSYERGLCKDEGTKEKFLEDKKAQRISDLQRFVSQKGSN